MQHPNYLVCYSQVCHKSMEQVQASYPLFLALLLSGHGLRKKSLSPSGALAAFAVGFLMISGGVRLFGVALIGFYLAGSRATKCECRWPSLLHTLRTLYLF